MSLTLIVSVFLLRFDGLWGGSAVGAPNVVVTLENAPTKRDVIQV